MREWLTRHAGRHPSRNNNGSNLMEQQPKKLPGEGVKFELIRRITGYLVGTLDRFNDAKHAEVSERLKHSMGAPR